MPPKKTTTQNVLGLPQRLIKTKETKSKSKAKLSDSNPASDTEELNLAKQSLKDLKVDITEKQKQKPDSESDSNSEFKEYINPNNVMAKPIDINSEKSESPEEQDNKSVTDEELQKPEVPEKEQLVFKIPDEPYLKQNNYKPNQTFPRNNYNKPRYNNYNPTYNKQDIYQNPNPNPNPTPNPTKTISIVGFTYDAYRNLVKPINSLSYEEMLKHMIVRAYDDNKQQLCETLKTVLRALNHECNFPEVHYPRSETSSRYSNMNPSRSETSSRYGNTNQPRTEPPPYSNSRY